MEKVDFKKTQKQFYQPKKNQPELVDVPPMQFLMVDGQGEPGNTAYQQAIEALFSLSYGLKFQAKQNRMDYGVLPLEGLWWADDMTSYTENRRDEWLWTLMIRQPDFIEGSLVAQMKTTVAEKKDLPALSKVRFEEFREGPCGQIMHIGPFSEEGPTIAMLHKYIEQQGHQLSGKHHEIYLSDIRRADPAKWKTVIRQPYS